MTDLSKEEINEIKDFMVGMEILRERDLINEFVYDVNDVKELLMLKYHSKNDEDKTIAERSCMFKNYTEIMARLKEQLINVTNLIECDDFKAEFGKLYRLPDCRIKEKIKKLKDMIERKNFSILTAGEGKAGKSTFVNLLLGHKLMPMDHRTCTRMICEVRNSPDKKATFIIDEDNSSKNHVICLKSGDMTEVNELVTREHSNPYTKVIFDYPVEILDTFTYLVDSPGIGDTYELNNTTFNLINESTPAVIFVLNASNSLGLNQRARILIATARKHMNKELNYCKYDDGTGENSKYSLGQLDKAIFILNHWDFIKRSVDYKEIENLRQLIITDIKLLWDSSVNENTQIFFFSAIQAQEWLDKGICQTELKSIRINLVNLISKIYEKNLQDCLMTLNNVLDDVERVILEKINANVDSKYTRLYNKEHIKKLCAILEDISKNSEFRKKDIIDKFKPHFNDMIESLTNHLKSDEFKDEILLSFKMVIKANRESKSKKRNNLSQSCPNMEKLSENTNCDIEHENVDIMSHILKNILEKEMFNELQKWENRTEQIKGLNATLHRLFEEQITHISNDIRLENLHMNETNLIGACNSMGHIPMKPLAHEMITKMEQIFVISAITLLFPVVAMASLLATPLIIKHLMDSKKTFDARQAQYDINKDEYLRNLINSSVQNITADYVRQQYFVEIQKQYMHQINDFDTCIKSKLKEKYQLLRDIEKENREFPDILSCLNVLLRRIEQCYGDYHMLRNQYLPDQSLIRRSAMYIDDNDAIPSKDETISMCQSSIVFRSKKNSNVLFKMYSKTFTRQFARFQMQEVNILSTGPFQYILKLKHMCYLEQEKKLLLVLEDAECNLYQYLHKNQDLVPVNFNRGTPNWKRAFRFILDVSKQLCICLNILHNFDIRMVHPDLRIDTVLVSKAETPDTVNLYICDACSNLPTQRMMQGSGSLPCEVTDLSFDMGGYTLENIYRLGIIFYDMAYFKGPPRGTSQSISSLEEELETLNNRSYESIESDVPIDWNHEQHCCIPTEYNDLIKRCLSKHPHDRPSAKQCLEMLSQITVEK